MAEDTAPQNRNVLARLRESGAPDTTVDPLWTHFFNTAPAIIFVLDQRGTFELSEGAGLEALGLEPGEAVGKSIFELYPDSPEILSNISSAIKGHPTHSQVAAAGRRFEAWYVPRRDHDGYITGVLGFALDITHRAKTDPVLHDALTGLANRNLFLDRVQQSVERLDRKPDYQFAVLMVDLDRFKIVNDSLGPAAGDFLLVAASKRLERCLRTVDTISRLGGDEFAILLEDIQDASHALRVSHRLQEELREPFLIEGQEVYSTASIGVVLSQPDYEDADELLRDADTAMHHAKQMGKSRHAVFDQAMHERAVAVLELESELRRAVENDEFVLHYQPIVSLADGRIQGFEALIRWEHPERGVLPPGAFLDVAEETGLIVQIGEGVIRKACRQLRQWRDDGAGPDDFFISVNLADRQFELPGLVPDLDAVLKEEGVSPEHLKLEITESVLMHDPEVAFGVFMRLRSLNVRLSIDDFGTGFSSLSYLHRFPHVIDTLKIDRSFISRMDVEVEKAEIVRTVILLARNLGLQVIAEGIEKPVHLDQLKVMNCEYGQGYFFSRPTHPRQSAELLRSPPSWLQ